MLEVNGLDVYYGPMQALYNVSLKVSEGEIVTVIGPNAAGKTTLLKTIAGVLRPTSGHVLFKGEKIDRLPPFDRVRKGIVLIPERGGIFPNMTVQENLELSAHIYRSRDEKEERFKSIFELFPALKDRRDQLAGTLSGGEQQMLNIALGLMMRPTLLMLDEPSSGLAPVFVKKIFEILRVINEKGVTILIVEQNVYHALSLAHRGYVLENGRIVLSGSGKDLLENPHVKKAYLGM
jgi:branched-chain amino acid transport system ATP-binding protein